MTDQAIFQKWPDRVAYDMDTAKARVETGRLIYAIFMCQQSLEKCFKALLAYQEKEVIPIHNLRRLAERKGRIPSPHRSPTFVFLAHDELL